MDITIHPEKVKSNDPFVICDNFIRLPQNVYIFGKSWREKFTETLRSMFNCINALEKDEDIGDFSYTPVEECINYLTAMTIEAKFTESLSAFIRAFIHIAHNVNQNLEKYDAVTKKIEYLQRYSENCLKYGEVLNSFNKICNRISTWKEWTPPSFRLSQHYMELFKEE